MVGFEWETPVFIFFFDDVWVFDLEMFIWEKFEINGFKFLVRYNFVGGYNVLIYEMIIFGGIKGISGMNYELFVDIWVFYLDNLIWW